MAQETLNHYMANHKPKGFSAKPQYFKDGDFVSYFLKDDTCFAQRLDEVVTVYISEDTGQLVGCKIKSITHLLKKMGDFAVMVEDFGNQVRLGLLFLTGATMTELSKRKTYLELAKQMGNVGIERDLLPMAA